MKKLRMVFCWFVLLVPMFAMADDSPQQRFNRSSFEPQISYPRIALAARVSGTVVVEISVEGNSISGRVVSGHPMLRLAALDAVKYSRLAAQVDGKFIVNFHFVLIGDDDWKSPDKTEWLLPDVTIVRRAMPVMVNTSR